MDNGQRNGKAEVQTIMSMLQAFSHSLKLLAQISDATVSAIDESERYRDAVKRKAHPLDINMLLGVIEKTPTYELTAEALRRATVLRFELGR